MPSRKKKCDLNKTYENNIGTMIMREKQKFKVNDV